MSEPAQWATVIVGLGNIGPKYEGTRHNVGFEVVDRLSQKFSGVPLRERPFYSGFVTGLDLADDEIHELIMIRPSTFMNRSGLAVETLLGEFDLKPKHLLVVTDDFNLPLGSLRFRPSGSNGGHNGLESIIETLGTQEFSRLRLGIGPLPEAAYPADFVLGPFAEEEREIVERMVAKAAEAVIFAVRHGLEKAMSQFNNTPASSEDS